MILPSPLKRYADKISGVSDERWSGDGYWVYLKYGWKDGSDPVGAVHAVHESTLREATEAMACVIPCNCQECSKGGSSK